MNLHLKGKVIILTGGANGISDVIFKKIADEGGIPHIIDRDESCKRTIEQILFEYGTIDGIVNNTLLNDNVSIEGDNCDKFGEYLDIVNLGLTCLKQSKGIIVNICAKGDLTNQNLTLASSTNEERFSSWAVKLAPFGIRVNTVIVSRLLNTQYQSWNLPSDLSHKFKDINTKFPLSNQTTNAAIAESVLFLLSPKSALINGQYLDICDGFINIEMN
jgi:L-fucose dehydrogenase